MKSIIYFSDHGDRPCIPVLVEHHPDYSAYETYKRHDPRYTGKHYYLGYVCTIRPDASIHEKIRARAEWISRTASIRLFKGHACPPDWKDKRRVGRDYQWYQSEKRIARSRFRNAKNLRRKGMIPHYACTDISFGLTLRPDAYTYREKCHIAARLELAASSRAPLPPWRLSDCWAEAEAA